MDTKTYKVRGKFKMGEEMQPFTKEVRALSKKEVYEKIYSEFGGRHGVSRREIIIEKIEKIKDPDDIEDPVIRQLVERVI
ncbi:LSU ribosomal protein LX [Methanothermus fervidus DSM 2088]|uniref:Large ribosomal subunit protein eL20 n=1 Tax=Methanothermus fervidus (strain ATCC 43054 / DSM 2088 / JCM 10308 / V24 S) TaxID=523846 RepID=E3GXD6_METFV|nr:50S ribosomal protein L18Ae [Methanothermus fervidus]ADP76968.1 LSU ribosomal protein LX [Methanothermus fervidus DSM 2088]